VTDGLVDLEEWKSKLETQSVLVWSILLIETTSFRLKADWANYLEYKKIHIFGV
jgi:hypothetical protein